jgi:predicted transposase YbfD/YdcC
VVDKTSTEYSYYISDLPTDNASGLLAYICGHWGVENNLHWCLDINFHEDDRRIRKGQAVENFSRLSRVALNLLGEGPPWAISSFTKSYPANPAAANNMAFVGNQ